MLMRFRLLLIVLLACAWPAGAAQDASPPPVKREIISGSELMTPAEREAYRQRFSAAKTPEGQEKVRSEHRLRIRERARLHGLQLADDPQPAAVPGKAKQ